MVSAEERLQIMIRSSNEACASLTQQNLHLLKTGWFSSVHESKANVVNQILETEQKLRFGAMMGTKILPDMTETSYIKLR